MEKIHTKAALRQKNAQKIGCVYVRGKYMNTDKLTQALEGFDKMGIPQNDCIIYVDGECVYRRMSGFSDFEKTKPTDGKEIYNIYSCSKMLTCTGALMLYQQGGFQLDDKLSDYLPEFAQMYVCKDGRLVKAENTITIRHLFTMTAGFTYDLNSPQLCLAREETQGRCPTREVMRYLAKEPLVFEPGTHYNYSLCHDVLAAVVEVISGKPFGQYMKESIFAPLGMTHTTYCPAKEQEADLCQQYTWENGKAVPCGKACDFRLGTEYESGGAGCVSSVEDYIKFLEAMRKGQLLNDETYALMATNQLTGAALQDFRNTLGFENDYGYGLGVRCPKAKDSWESDIGWGGAGGCYPLLDRKNKVTMFYAQHVVWSPVNQEMDGLRLLF